MLPAVFVALAVAVVIGWAAGFVAASSAGRGLCRASWLLTAAAAVLAVVAGGRALAGHGTTWGLGWLTIGIGDGSLTVDRLTGLFLVVAAAVAVPALLAGAATAVDARPRLPALLAVTLAGVVGIMTADQLFVLLFGWELLTLSFYLLTVFDRGEPSRSAAAVITAFFGKASGAAILIGGGLLAADTHSLVLADWGHAGGAARSAGYALLIGGFAVKIGAVPVHVWLPGSYAAAPAPARAVMAAVAVNVGFYGLWRTLQLLGPAPVWLITIVLLAAGITAVIGIAHAAVNSNLPRLIAWSSVENAGVIGAGYGVALIGATVGDQQMVAVGLVAGTGQIVAHALAKALMFVAADRISAATGSIDLDELRGITRLLRWSGWGLVVGSVTLAGLPLTVAFASEWFTLESLMQAFRMHVLALQLATAIAGALVALTVGIAGVTFTRVIALTAFGRPVTVGRRQAENRGTAAAVVLLAIGCLGLAAAAPWEFRVIATGLRPIVGSAAAGANRSPWVLQPVYPGFAALSPSWLWVAVPALTAIILGVAWLFAGNRLFRTRTVPPWTSGSHSVASPGYTSFGYANPMRRVLADVLLTRRQLDAATQPEPNYEVATRPRVVTVEAPAALIYRIDVAEVIERYLYRPVWRALLAAARMAKRLQSGRLDAYLAYMMVAVVAVLIVTIATSP